MATRTSESLVKLAPALLAAQQKMVNVDLDGKNPHFNSKFATLPGVLEAIKGPLNANGIVLLQFPSEAPDGHLGLTTRLQHDSGEFVEDTAIVPLPKSDPQGYGSAITYTRRYGLLSVCGLVGEADDDGNAASGSGKPAASTPRSAPAGGFFKPKAAEPAPAPAKAPEKKKAGLFPSVKTDK